jgi:methyl-accepting chemotaxis protein
MNETNNQEASQISVDRQEFERLKLDAASAARLRSELDSLNGWVSQAADVCRSAAAGELEPRILRVDCDGDLGDLLHGINHLLDMTDAFVREVGATLTYASNGKYYRKLIETGMLGSFKRASVIINRASDSMASGARALEDADTARITLAGNFEETITGIVSTVAAAATEMQTTAVGLTENANTTSERAIELTQSSDSTMREIESMAAMIEEFSASAQEIARQVEGSNASTGLAEKEATETNAKVGELADASATISQVLTMIQSVAEQTNLLALNATIEAARAGEAGKGFAVVAGEVKNLSGQTQSATVQINNQVHGIQLATKSVVTAIASICERIKDLTSISSTIAISVEEQSAVTQNMSRNADGAARGARQVSDAVGAVAIVAEETSEASNQFLVASQELSVLAETLKREASSFVDRIRG